MASIVDYLKSQGQDSSYANRATLASQKGIQGYQGTAAQNTQLLGLLSQPAPTTVSTSALQPGSKIAIPQNNVSQMPQLPVVSPQETAVNNAMTQNSQAEQGYTQANTDLQTLSKQLENKGTDTLALEQQQGIPQISQKVLELQDLANQKALEANLTPYSLQGQGRGITTGILRGQEAVKQRQLQVEGIFANAQLQAAQGKLQLAQSQVDRAINLKYEPILARIDAQKQILENNKYLLSRADQKLASAKSELLSQQKMEQEKKMEDEKRSQEILLKAQVGGAPANLISTVAKGISDGTLSTTKVTQMLGQYTGPIPASAQEYQYAVNQGYKGSFSQYQTEDANRKAVASKVSDSTVVAPEDATKALGQLSFLKKTVESAEKLKAASGQSGLRTKAGDWFVGGTKYRQLENMNNTLRTNILTMMVDPAVKKFFGPQMTNQDVRLMTAGGTTLNVESQTPEQMQEELTRLKDLFQRAEDAVKRGIGEPAGQMSTQTNQTPAPQFEGYTLGADGKYYKNK